MAFSTRTVPNGAMCVLITENYLDDFRIAATVIKRILELYRWPAAQACSTSSWDRR
jgi:hypothetical protein